MGDALITRRGGSGSTDPADLVLSNKVELTCTALTGRTGNWSIPSDVQSLGYCYVTMVGGGGGGGSGAAGSSSYGGGGGSGGGGGGRVYRHKLTISEHTTSDAPTTIRYSIGAQGTESNKASGIAATPGGSTSFGNLSVSGGEVGLDGVTAASTLGARLGGMGGAYGGAAGRRPTTDPINYVTGRPGSNNFYGTYSGVGGLGGSSAGSSNAHATGGGGGGAGLGTDGGDGGDGGPSGESGYTASDAQYSSTPASGRGAGGGGGGGSGRNSSVSNRGGDGECGYISIEW